MSRFAVISMVALSDTRLSPRDITVLAALGAYTDKEGWCHPSLAQIGELLGVSRQAVQKSVRHLEQCGYLTRHERFEEYGRYRRQATNLYHVNADYVPPEEFVRKPEKEAENSHTPPQPQVAPPATTGCTPPQPQVAPPATSEVAPPATSEVAPKNNPDELPRRSVAAGAAPARVREKGAPPDSQSSHQPDDPPSDSKRKSQRLKTDGLPISPELARELIAYRRQMRKPLTQRALNALAKAVAQTAQACGLSQEQVVEEMQLAGWQSVKPEWLQRRLTERSPPAGSGSGGGDLTMEDIYDAW